LTRNGGIKIEDIESHPNFKWQKNIIYQNPSMTRNYYAKNLNIDKFTPLEI